jgi:hypothetical protein
MFQVDQYVLWEEMVKYRELGTALALVHIILSLHLYHIAVWLAHSSTQKMKAASSFTVLVLSTRLCEVTCQKTVF